MKHQIGDLGITHSGTLLMIKEYHEHNNSYTVERIGEEMPGTTIMFGYTFTIYKSLLDQYKSRLTFSQR